MSEQASFAPIFVVRQVGLHTRWEFEAGRVALGSLVSLNVNTLGWAYHSIIFESDFLNTVSSTAVRSSPFGPFWKRLMKLCVRAERREGNGQRGVRLLLERERSVCSIVRLGRAHSKKTANVPP